MFETPILLLIFNRPDTTAQVFEAIKIVKPKNLFLAADGPREGNKDDIINCEEVRKYVLDNIDWDCEIKKLFREKNLGCGKGVSSAITWFFENVEEGIILEDDCVPSLSFFNYCSKLLEKYRHNSDVFLIGGSNFQKKRRGKESYYFSAYGHVWGWASWRRAWKYYDFSLNSISDREFYNCLNFYFSKNREKFYWYEIFKRMKYDPIDTWDYQWTFSQWYNKGINIIPNLNLVNNIGFNDNATHTKQFVAGISDRPSNDIIIMNYPSKIVINRKADLFTFDNHYLVKESLKDRIIKRGILTKNKIKNGLLRLGALLVNLIKYK
jgi:hypothetical protein